jgi:hypothetical protein
MSNSDDNAEAYEEIIPVRIWGPGIPIPAPQELSGKRGQLKRRPVLTTGMTTPMMSLGEAAANTARLLERYRKKVRKDFRTVLELLDIQPEFVQVPWVQKAFDRVMKLGRAKRRRGRPAGSYKTNPAFALGFVMALRASGKAKTDHAAVMLLMRRGILTYDQGLHALRAAQKDLRLRPLWVPSTTAEAPSAEELAELLQKAITPRPGETLQYRLDPDGVMRLVKVTAPDASEQRHSPKA